MDLVASIALLAGFILGVQIMLGDTPGGTGAVLGGLFANVARLGRAPGLQEADAATPFRLGHAEALRPIRSRRAGQAETGGPAGDGVPTIVELDRATIPVSRVDPG